ncbi:hypothetical protein M011DRAFT_479210 [Sporormia fimetaria CBS 119925]|uniref:Uncharacterized protein n=1 Tax=Sporormia fimetaria CBS 119925 TaxID=1340428 RepID=A0A6A6V4R8_9PLEO|nr:hypothetical protein M011DRAFT_479210 [Sporormia fimetaria CBS 119925]
MEKTTRSDSVEKTMTTTTKSEGVGEVRPKKHFTLLAALGVQFSVTATPLTLATYLSLTIGVGGSAGFFWRFIFVGFFQLAVCLTVAELASALPHSSGPAYWVLVLAPPRYARTMGLLHRLDHHRCLDPHHGRLLPLPGSTYPGSGLGTLPGIREA